MKNSSLIKWFAALTVLIFVNVAILNFWKFNTPDAAKPAPASGQAHDYSATYKPLLSKAALADAEETGAEEPTQPKISRDKAEAWLAKHNRNAMSLLAVFRALGDTNYLNEAATNFPNDPQVELAVLSRNAYPEDRRKWLDLFKHSSPSNSLANYLSAADYFKSGKPEEAVQEVLAAWGKGQFQNDAMETLLSGEALYLDSGENQVGVATFAMSDMAEDNLSRLTDFRRVAQGLSEVMKADPSSAAELAEVGLDFTDKINSGDSGKFLINKLVGAVSEVIILSQLDQNTAYVFLNGQTPAQVTEALKQQRIELRKLMTDFTPVGFQMMMSESETASYNQRVKIYGELEAMKWAIQQHPQKSP